MKVGPKGAIHRVVEFVVSCGLCDASVTGANTRKEAASEARGLGWKVVRYLGWVCRKHTRIEIKLALREIDDRERRERLAAPDPA